MIGRRLRCEDYFSDLAIHAQLKESLYRLDMLCARLIGYFNELLESRGRFSKVKN